MPLRHAPFSQSSKPRACLSGYARINGAE